MSDPESTNVGGTDHREYVLNADGTVLYDHKVAPVTVDRFLATKPLRDAVSTRPGPGGRKLSYMSGDVITKTLNEAFGFDGWSLDVKGTTREENVKDDKGRYHVAYIATVRITHRRSGVYREDCGSGDAIDKSLAAACGNALKSAITDGMKRAARHFGEKLGNSLYNDGFQANKAPGTLKDALEMLDIERAKSRFGFDKKPSIGTNNQSVNDCDGGASVANNHINATTKIQTNTYANQANRNQSITTTVANKPPVKAERPQIKNSYNPNTSTSNPSKANTTYSTAASTSNNNNSSSAATSDIPKVINVANQYSNPATNAHKTASIAAPVSINIPSNTPATTRAMTTDGRPQRHSDPFPFANFVATPAVTDNGVVNSNATAASNGKGFDFLNRPGTSRGIASLPNDNNNNISNNGIQQSLHNGMNAVGGNNSGDAGYAYDQQQNQTGLSHALKRKAEGNNDNNASCVTKTTGSGVRNPYSC